ncbi:MAG TPA: STAS domain-containing protein [Candidatus Eremiobacteraceae bacterium]|nr:STAS domain-containing protein [Candidatus Eremiobacteraceae bacterium]
MILDIEHKKIEPDIFVMEMHGRITMGSDSQKIEWGVAQLLNESQKKVIFDLTDVSYVDSSGVGILMMCHAKLTKAGGALHLVGVQGFVEEALAITSVNKIVPLYSTTAQAAGHFHRASNAGSDC